MTVPSCPQEEGCPDINIICERITVGGLPTRFEDQTRLPMGVSVNSTSYSAKLLQARRSLDTILQSQVHVLAQSVSLTTAPNSAAMNSTSYSKLLQACCTLDTSLHDEMLVLLVCFGLDIAPILLEHGPRTCQHIERQPQYGPAACQLLKSV